MDSRVKSVVILGGGTAGWMTASYLSRALQESVRITVIEAPTIPRIGVGEATVPNLQRVLFDFLGIDEDEWMRECKASFKMAVKFINWRTGGQGNLSPRQDTAGSDHFFHPFGLLPVHEGLPLSHYWVARKHLGKGSEPFDYACFQEPVLMDRKLSPRRFDGERVTRYAWHFDAQNVAAFLRRFATRKQGVTHIEDEMCEVVIGERGFISGLRTAHNGVISGDLFIDCSGFRGLLINQAMREPFVDMSNQLLCDSAVATNVSHDEDNGIEPFTSAIAMESGWTWKIPLLDRFGTGYVYSSQFCGPDQATADLCGLWGLDPDSTPLNKIRFRVGRNRRAWVRNCVSIGLSSCFVEPLESTGIYFITAAVYQLVKHFPDRSFDPRLADRFNREIEMMFDDTLDFIQAHFYVSPRLDTPFWRANKDLRLSPGISEKIAMYRVGLPVNMPVTDESTYYGNFEAEFRNFWTNGSYYSIFAGLGLIPDQPLPLLGHRPAWIRAAEPLFDEVKRRQRDLAASVPTNLAYLRRLHVG